MEEGSGTRLQSLGSGFCTIRYVFDSSLGLKFQHCPLGSDFQVIWQLISMIDLFDLNVFIKNNKYPCQHVTSSKHSGLLAIDVIERTWRNR